MKKSIWIFPLMGLMLLFAGCGAEEGDIATPHLTIDGIDDTTGPTVPLSGELEPGATLAFTVYPSAGVEIGEIVIGGGDWSSSLTFPADGAYEVWIRAYDAAGNTSVLFFPLQVGATAEDVQALAPLDTPPL